MNIGLFAPDSKIPNYAIMKLSAYHKSLGDEVSWYMPILRGTYDKVYVSLIFSYSEKPKIYDNMICGGSGFDLTTELPKEIDDFELDYSLYPDFKQAIGFLTRGCIRKCNFCIVPIKEGKLRAYRDIESIAIDRKEVKLLDNNVLASAHGLKQIEKIVDLGLKVDFNQGLDARLITDDIAKLLAKVHWKPYLRLACDNDEMIEPVRKAVELLRWHNCTPREYFIYVLAKDVETTLKRVKFLKGICTKPFVQPFIDRDGNRVNKKTRNFAIFVDKKQIFNSTTWEEYVHSYKQSNDEKELSDFARYTNHTAIFKSITWKQYKQIENEKELPFL